MDNKLVKVTIGITTEVGQPRDGEEFSSCCGEVFIH